MLGEPSLKEPVLVPLTSPRMGATVLSRGTQQSRETGQKKSHPIVIPAPRKIEYSGESTQINGIKIETNLSEEETGAVDGLVTSFGAGEARRSLYQWRQYLGTNDAYGPLGQAQEQVVWSVATTCVHKMPRSRPDTTVVAHGRSSQCTQQRRTNSKGIWRQHNTTEPSSSISRASWSLMSKTWSTKLQTSQGVSVRVILPRHQAL